MYRIDPEQSESRSLLKLTGSLENKRVLEIGCGDGRLTWRYAAEAGNVVAIDPNQERVDLARRDNPYPHVRFESIDLFAYADPTPFDIVLLSWAL